MSSQFLSQSIPEITVEELALRLAEGFSEPVQLLDVREPEELEIARLQGFENLPLSAFSEWAGEICTRFDPHTETIVLCHHGIRSAQMCKWLLQQGFTNVKNVAGGIDAYALAVEPTLPRY